MAVLTTNLLIHQNTHAALTELHDRYMRVSDPIYASLLKHGGMKLKFVEFANVLILRGCVDYHKELDEVEKFSALHKKEGADNGGA